MSGKLKDEIAVILSIIASFVCAFIPYFSEYLTLPFTIITFFLVLITLTNLYFMLSFSSRMRKVESVTRRDSLVLNVLITGFTKLHKLSRSKGITITQFIQVFSEAIEGVFDSITKDYFSTPLSNPGPEQERRKQELLRKARQRQISYEEGQELQRLLEEQKRQHEARGDIGGAILLGLLILFLIGVLAALFGSREN